MWMKSSLIPDQLASLESQLIWVNTVLEKRLDICKFKAVCTVGLILGVPKRYS